MGCVLKVSMGAVLHAGVRKNTIKFAVSMEGVVIAAGYEGGRLRRQSRDKIYGMGVCLSNMHCQLLCESWER